MHSMHVDRKTIDPFVTARHQEKHYFTETSSMLTDNESNRVNEEMLVAVTAAGHHTDIHDYGHDGEPDVNIDGVVQADGSEFTYASGTSREEVAMIEALLRQTATREATASTVSASGTPTSTIAASIIKSAEGDRHSSHITRMSQASELINAPSNSTLHATHNGVIDENTMERQCLECNGDDSISGNKLMFCSSCSRSFHQLCHNPVVDDVWAETIAEWLCHDCIQKYGIHFDTEDQDLEDAHVTDHMDHETHSQASGSVMTIEDDASKTSNRRMEQAVSGIGISYAQKKNYLNTLPKSVLVDLVLACDATHPDMPLFPASLHVQAAVIGDDSMTDYERMAEWAHETAMRTPARPRNKVVGSADRLPSETVQTGQETVTGLAPRRTYGRRAPRSAVGAPLPSYEDLCVEAVLNMNNENGSLPKRIFEWIATKYPVAANFRPSCSQALQRAFRKGKLDKHGRAYKVSQSEMVHVKEFQERRRRMQEESQSQGDAESTRNHNDEHSNDEFQSGMDSMTDLHVSMMDDLTNGVKEEKESANFEEEEDQEEKRYLEASSLSNGDITMSSDIVTITAGNHHDNHVNVNNDDNDADDSNANVTTEFDDAMSVKFDTSLVTDTSVDLAAYEATEEDTAAIVAAVTAATDMNLTGSGDDIDIDDSHALDSSTATMLDVESFTKSQKHKRKNKNTESIVDVELDETDEMLDVGTEIDVDGDAAYSARTTPTRHQQHRNQRKKKRSRSDIDTVSSSTSGESRLARRKVGDEAKATSSNNNNSDDEIISVDYVNGNTATVSSPLSTSAMLNGTYQSADT